MLARTHRVWPALQACHISAACSYSLADKLTEPTSWLIIGGVCVLLLVLIGVFIYVNNRRAEGRRAFPFSYRLLP
jgi:hypothetical protein